MESPAREPSPTRTLGSPAGKWRRRGCDLRHRIAWIALGVVLLAATGVLGFVLVSRWLPARVRSAGEQALTAALGSDVQVGAVRLLYGPGIRVEATEVAAFPAADGPALRVPRATVSIHWLDLVFGRVEPSRISLDGATLRLVRGADGALEPRALVERLATLVAARPAKAAPEDLLAPVRQAAHAVRGLVLPDLDVELTGARIELVDRAATAGSRTLRLEDLDGRVAVGGFRHDLDVELRGSVADARGPRGRVELAGDRAGARLHGVVTVTGLDLGLATALGVLPKDALAGALTGSLDVTIDSPPGQETRSGAELDGVVTGLAFTPPGSPRGAASRVRFEAARLRATIHADPRKLTLGAATLTVAGQALSLHGSAVRPLAPEAPVELTLRAERLSVASARALVGGLPSRTRGAADPALAAVESGAVDALEITATAPLAHWEALFGGEPGALGDALTVTGFVHDLAIRLDADDRLEGVSGVVVWKGDALDLRGVQGKLRGEALPQLDLALTGLSNLAGARRAPGPSPAASSLPGRKPLGEMLAPEPGEENLPPRWTEVVFDIDAMHHPALAFPLENAHVVVTPTQGGVHLEISGGRWGGVPVAVRGDWTAKPTERFRLSLDAAPPDSAPPPVAAGENWARGRFRVVLPPPAPGDPRIPIVIASVAGWFRATGDSVRAFEGELRLRPGGVLRGEATFDGSRTDGIPFRATLRLEEATVSDLAVMFGAPAESATGALVAHGELDTVLAPHVPLFAPGKGWASVRATDGELRQRLGLFVAVASVSETLNPFASRDRIRYRTVDAELTLADGRLSTSALTVDSPDLRVVASGSLGVTKPYTLESVVALFFFGKVSSIVGMVPVLSNILLSKDGSLMGAYFEVAGPYDAPTAKLVPSKSLTETGPARLVLDGVPSFVRSGIDAIESVMGGPKAAPAGAGPAPAPSPPPAPEAP